MKRSTATPGSVATSRAQVAGAPTSGIPRFKVSWQTNIDQCTGVLGYVDALRDVRCCRFVEVNHSSHPDATQRLLELLHQAARRSVVGGSILP